MPYASLAQARKFHADPRLRQYAPEFDAATDFSKLPNRAPAARERMRKGGHKANIQALARLR